MTGTGEKDALLVVRGQLGDREALEELVRRWHPPLWRFVLGMLTDRTAGVPIFAFLIRTCVNRE